MHDISKKNKFEIINSWVHAVRRGDGERSDEICVFSFSFFFLIARVSDMPVRVMFFLFFPEYSRQHTREKKVNPNERENSPYL